jgi:rare lipoprotein A (peptidoglycan hydrolase)
MALRGAGLAAVALVAGTLALALTHTKASSHPKLPQGVGDWHAVLAAAYTPTSRRGACGVLIGKSTMGVAHPVLPCGVKLYIRYGDNEVLTQVIDRGPSAPGREFDLTRALAKQLGVVGTQTIEWRYAR